MPTIRAPATIANSSRLACSDRPNRSRLAWRRTPFFPRTIPSGSSRPAVRRARASRRWPAGRHRSVGRVAGTPCAHTDRAGPRRDRSHPTRRASVGDRAGGRHHRRAVESRASWCSAGRPVAPATPQPRPTEAGVPDLPFAGTTVASATTQAPARLVAHAAGAVVHPGVYELAAGSRVGDLITAAGGVSPDGDADRLNLAAPLTDGVRLYVPRRGETDIPAVAEPDQRRGADPVRHRDGGTGPGRPQPGHARAARGSTGNRAVDRPGDHRPPRQQRPVPIGRRPVGRAWSGPGAPRTTSPAGEGVKTRRELALGDPAVFVAAIVVVGGAWFAWPVSPWLVVVVAGLALALRHPAVVILALGLLASCLAARAWAGMHPPDDRTVQGAATLVSDPVQANGAVHAEVRLDGHHYDAWVRGAGAGHTGPPVGRRAGRPLRLRQPWFVAGVAHVPPCGEPASGRSRRATRRRQPAGSHGEHDPSGARPWRRAAGPGTTHALHGLGHR